MLSLIHPGEVLLEDFMKPLGLSQYRLVFDIGVTPIRISQIVHGKRAISVDTAMRLTRYFGTSAAVWLRLQVRYDLEVAEGQLSERINHEVNWEHGFAQRSFDSTRRLGAHTAHGSIGFYEANDPSFQEQITWLEKEVSRLREQINKNSRNSSKPLSSEGSFGSRVQAMIG